MTAVLAPRRPIRNTTFHRFAHSPLLPELLFTRLGLLPRVLHRCQGDRASISGAVARAYRWPLRRRRDRISNLALARLVPNREDHPALPELDTIDGWIRAFEGPLHLVWGLRDPVLGRAHRRLVRELSPASVTETQAGHFLQEEVPHELARAIRAVTQE